ncbi:MAG TPA: hypothetical protein VIV66_03610 [Pyrinomonadaceae bacterium]
MLACRRAFPLLKQKQSAFRGEVLFRDGTVGNVTLGIAPAAVNTSQLADGAVTSTKLAPDAVTSAALNVPLALSGSSAGPILLVTNSGAGAAV